MTITIEEGAMNVQGIADRMREIAECIKRSNAALDRQQAEDATRLVRVWLSGPVTFIDDHGTHIQGEHIDLPINTRIALELTAEHEPPWTHAIDEAQEFDRSVFVWILHNNAWTEARIEPGSETRLRTAVLAERDAILAKIEECLGSDSAAEMLDKVRALARLLRTQER